MIALTLHQPFASLVMRRIKRTETRSWAAPDTVIGNRIAIHAARRVPIDVDPLVEKICREWLGENWALEVPLGCLLGTVRVDRCERMPIVGPKSWQDRACGIWKLGRFGWDLSDPIRFADPVPCRGYQRLWRVRDEIIEAAGGVV